MTSCRCDCENDCGRTVRSVATDAFHVSESVYNPGLEIPPHAHDYPGFCMVLDGEYRVDFGRAQLRCAPSTLLFHPAGAMHSDVISRKGSRCLLVGIDPHLLEALPDKGQQLVESRASWRGTASWLAFRLSAELASLDALSPLVVEGIALAMLAHFVRQPGLRADAAAPSWLEQVKERIHDEFAHPLRLADLASSVGVHRVHLARAFRAHYGVTVGEYVRRQRVEFATQRLITSDSSLAEIALTAGFADQSHFTTAFKRLVGLTPAAFRSQFARR